MLLRAGAEVDKPGEVGQTALILAVRREGRARSRRIVRLLLEAGADPNARDPLGWTALIYAVHEAFRGKQARLVAELIRAGADVDARLATGKTALAMRAVAQQCRGGRDAPRRRSPGADRMSVEPSSRGPSPALRRPGLEVAQQPGDIVADEVGDDLVGAGLHGDRRPGGWW